MKTTTTLLTAAVLGVFAAAFVLNGCVRPFDTPEYVEVETDETAFVLPLEGDTLKPTESWLSTQIAWSNRAVPLLDSAVHSRVTGERLTLITFTAGIH